MPLLVSKAYERRRLQMLAANVQGPTVLDIGYAQHPNPFFTDCYRVGVDLCAPNRPSGYEEELIGNACALETLFPDRMFHSIVCAEFIEHIEQPYDFLRSLHGILEADGKLLLSTPNPLGFPVVVAEYLRNKRFFYTDDHVYYFTPRWMERMLVRSGFQVEAVLPVGLWLPKGYLPIPIVSSSYQVIYVARRK